MSALKWVLGIGAICVVLIMGLALVGILAVFFLVPQPIPDVIPANAYNDANVYIELPSWSTGDESVSGSNLLFTFNPEEGRSYALNYHGGSESAPELSVLSKENCASNEYCEVTDEFVYNGKADIQFMVFCIEEYDDTLEWTDKCFAMAGCNQKVLIVSAVQDWESSYGEHAVLPLDEFKAVLSSAVCK